MALVFTSIVFGISYVLLIGTYVHYWNKVPIQVSQVKVAPKTTFSILIPARNEEPQILTTLNSIGNLDYPKELYEVILVDDFSEDHTIACALDSNLENLRVLKLEDFLANKPANSFKKEALSIGIQNASNDIIVTTDADCIVPPKWLRFFADSIENEGLEFIGGPVLFNQEQNLLQKFQSLDFTGTMLVTIGGLKSGLMYLCNGANLAYSKSLFEAVDGFKNIDHVASGDDVLLLQKIAKFYPEKIGFIKNKEAVVSTTAKSTISGFWNQRIRWATKSSQYEQKQVLVVLGIVYLFCLSICLNLIGAVIFWNKAYFYAFIGLLIAKSIVDFWMLRKATYFFGREKLLSVFWPSQFLHILYIVSIGTWSNIQKKYKWKGRTVQ